MEPALLKRAIDLAVPFAPFLRAAEARPAFAGWTELLWRQIPLTFLLWWLCSLVPYAGTFLYSLILVPLAIALHWREFGVVGRAERAAVALRYYVVILIGFGGLWSFVGHTVMADSVAGQIGWPADSPFQTELAFFTLGAAVSALLAIWIRDHLVTALVVTKSVFWYGAAGVHLWDAAAHGNWSPLNVGAPLVGDLVFPTLLLWLLWRARNSPARALRVRD